MGRAVDADGFGGVGGVGGGDLVGGKPPSVSNPMVVAVVCGFLSLN